MSDDDENKPHHATARPPPGEEDVYSASTVVGEASDEILAIIRGDKAPAAPSIPKDLEIAPAEPKSPEPKVESKPETTADDAKPPPPVTPPASAKPAYKSTPLEVPVTSLDAEVETKAETKSKRPSSAPLADVGAEEKPSSKQGGLPPALGIVLFFVAVVAALAALIR